jgi:hypothetical protein
MKKIIIALISFTLSGAPLMAKNLEGLRKSSEDISIDTASLKKDSAAVQYTSTATPVLLQLIANFFKLLFSANGDIEISNPSTEVPQMEGAMEDDQVEEQYTEGSSYTPLDPAELQEPQAAQPQQFQTFRPFQQPQASRMQQAQAPRQPAPSGGGRSGVIPEDLKRKALEYFNTNADRIQNKRYIGIVDFAAHSSKERFFILDMQTGSVRAMHVAHGKGSDPDGDGYATRFSNVPNSLASSLGFYLTGALYSGSHGKSMRLLGQSPTNSNVLSRAVVIHESAYVKEAPLLPGRSFGCLAVSATEIRAVLASLNGGALIYAGLSNSEF